jgi:hypothetical protein
MRERFYRIRPTIACRPLILSVEEWATLTEVISGVPGVASCESTHKFKKVRVIIQDDAFIGDI